MIGTPPKEDEAGRFGFGTTIAVDALFKDIRNMRGSNEIVIAINISTLLRNALSEFTFVNGQKIVNKESHGLNTTGVVEKVKSYMGEIANEFAQICDSMFRDRHHHVLYYLTDNRKQVPSGWVKDTKSESSARLDVAVAAFMKSTKSEDQTFKNVSMHVRLADQMRIPSFKGLAEVIKSFSMASTPIRLISHMPLDYHVANYAGREGWLYRSHTGEIVKLSPSELGRIVFKNTDIPFYPVTHILFGDKYLVKGSLNKKDRDKFVEAAKTFHWGMRTSEYIEVKVREYNYALPFRLG